MKLSEHETITDEAKFIKGHESIIANPKINKEMKQPYVDRLNKYWKLKKKV